MLTYVLIWIISLGSLGLYLAAYLFPEVHRKNDFIWGAVGLFYALILWANAKTISGGLLVGQMASVSLIIWLGQQTLRQRQLLAPADVSRPQPGSVSDRLRRLIIQAWKLVEPVVAFIAGFIAKVLEKPQKANIAEIEVGVAEATKPSFLDQFTDPLSSLSGNLTRLFKSGEKSPAAVNTVTVKATPAFEEDVIEDKRTPATETETNEMVQNRETVAPPEISATIETSPPKVEAPLPVENPVEPLSTSDIQDQDLEPSTQSSASAGAADAADMESIQETRADIQEMMASGLLSVIAPLTEPVDPQSALSPIEIETDRCSAQASETAEAQAPIKTPAEVTTEVPERQTQAEEAVNAEHSKLAEKDSSPENQLAEPEAASSAVTGGDLQPESKPEEWTGTDPLA